MRYFKKVVGERVYLSPINIEDAEKYTEWFNSPAVSFNVGAADKVYSLEREKEALEKLSKEGYNFAIVSLENNELLGNCSLMKVNQVDRVAELGIFIGNEKYRDRGMGTEAIRLLLDFGFNILNLRNVMLKVFSYNKRAIRCYEKCGFKVVGRRRKARLIGKKEYDDIYMDILDEEFEGSFVDKFISE